MPWLDILWDWNNPDGNVAHIAEHGVTPEEVRQVLEAPATIPRPSRSQPSRTVVAGFTRTGRYLVVVFEQVDSMTVLPVTAFEPSTGAPQ
jgi:uncharacterized DUF497 family protein